MQKPSVRIQASCHQAQNYFDKTTLSLWIVLNNYNSGSLELTQSISLSFWVHNIPRSCDEELGVFLSDKAIFPP